MTIKMRMSFEELEKYNKKDSAETCKKDLIVEDDYYCEYDDDNNVDSGNYYVGRGRYED